MKKKLKSGIPVFLSFLLVHCTEKESIQLSNEQILANFFQKESVKILVTDSGLGGVSVAADVVERLKMNRVFKKAEVVFFNAQPHIKSGYNVIEHHDQKVRVFENAIRAMDKNFNPDIILIACNTLSVLYPYTKFSQVAEIPVIGIVEKGVELIQKKMEQTPDAQVIIFATKTTVAADAHKKSLVDKGIPQETIFTQACPKLAGSIERGSHNEKTRALVKGYVDSVMVKSQMNPENIFVSLNCTHYGYIADLFIEAFQEQGIQIKELLDPNPLMADFIFQEEYVNRYSECEVVVKVYSQPEMPVKRTESIAGLIEKISPQAAEALKSYVFVPEFFEWRSIAEENPD
jgi:glutamate racemase